MSRNPRCGRATSPTSATCPFPGPARSAGRRWTSPAHEIHDLAYSIIRVLDRQGEAVGPWAPGLDAEALKAGLRAMMQTRAYDERM